MKWLDWILTGGRFVGLAGSILLASIFGFRLLIRGSHKQQTGSELFPERLTLVLGLAACLGQIAWVGALFWSMDPDLGSDGLGDFSAFFFGTQVGKIGFLRCCVLIVLVAYSAFRKRTMRMGGSSFLPPIEPALAITQLVLLSWLSHAAAVVGPLSWFQLGNDILHLACVAIWPGALVPLWLFLKQPGPELIKRETLLRFSNIALFVAPLVGSTGVLSGYFRVHSVAPLITTPYGRYVLFKAACFFVLIGLGAVNRFRVIPGLVANSAQVRSPAERWGKLQRNILIEQLIFVLVLAAVARLVQLPPPEG